MVMHRRLFLRIAALGTAALLTGIVGRAAVRDGAGDGATDAADDDPHLLALPDLLDVLGAERVRAIGRRYRELVPAERDAAALRAALRAGRPLLAGLRGMPRVAPAELVRRDFAEGRTVEVGGWVLSRTEARQCALYSLRSA